MAESPTGAYLVNQGVQNIWVHFRGESNPVYWGTSVTAPEFQEMPHQLEVFNDIGGRQEPFQLVYDGSSALISVTANRLDLAVTRRMRSYAHTQGGTLTGYDQYNDRGSLMLGRLDFSIIFTNANYGTTQAVPGMVAGRKYWSCTLSGYKESQAGTRVMEAACVFRSWSLWQGAGQGFLRFTEDSSLFGTLTLG